MEDNKLIKTKEGIFSKILKRIKLFFFGKSDMQQAKEEKTTIQEINIKEELKVQVKNDNIYQKEKFMKKIGDNPDLLENFSLERLEKIKKYYQESIKRKEEILYNMKKV